MLIGDIYCSGRTADYTDADGSVMMLCDGRAINRITYATLFALCGVAYGIGDGATTFNIPQFGLSGGMRGRSPIGASPAGGYVLGAQGGVEQHGHTIAGVTPGHTFSAPGTTTFAIPAAARQCQAGGFTAAATGHTHNPFAAHPAHAALPNPDNANYVTPVLGTGLFIKVL
jgi:microcystin-dependent protein